MSAHSARSPHSQHPSASPLSPYTSTPISAAFASELQRLPLPQQQKVTSSSGGYNHATTTSFGQSQQPGPFNFFDNSLPPSSAQLHAHMQSSAQALPRGVASHHSMGTARRIVSVSNLLTCWNCSTSATTATSSSNLNLSRTAQRVMRTLFLPLPVQGLDP